MASSESSDQPLDEPDAGPAAGSLPVEPADNGEPVLDPDADENEAARRAQAGVERLEHHQRGHGDGEPTA